MAECAPCWLERLISSSQFINLWIELFFSFIKRLAERYELSVYRACTHVDPGPAAPLKHTAEFNHQVASLCTVSSALLKNSSNIEEETHIGCSAFLWCFLFLLCLNGCVQKEIRCAAPCGKSFYQRIYGHLKEYLLSNMFHPRPLSFHPKRTTTPLLLIFLLLIFLLLLAVWASADGSKGLWIDHEKKQLRLFSTQQQTDVCELGSRNH